jgi:hypothetical protein
LKFISRTDARGGAGGTEIIREQKVTVGVIPEEGALAIFRRQREVAEVGREGFGEVDVLALATEEIIRSDG